MDKNLIAKIYETYGNELTLYLYSLCGNWQQAEDLLQETFVRAILSLPSNHGNTRAWIYMVARNLFINQYRRNVKCNQLYRETICENMPDVLCDILKSERNITLYNCINKLNYTKREVIIMFYFGGIPLSQIGKILNISQENVRVINYRAKKELKKLLEEVGYDIS